MVCGQLLKRRNVEMGVPEAQWRRVVSRGMQRRAWSETDIGSFCKVLCGAMYCCSGAGGRCKGA